MKRTPDEELADAIAAALIDAGLVREMRRGVLAQKVAAGEITAEQWRRVIEEGLRAREEAGGEPRD